MNLSEIRGGLAISVLSGTVLLSAPALAQVTPDGTLNTTVAQSGNNYTITNGTAAATNLYHSFQQFSIPTGGSATFDLNATPNITTIFSRVTGGNASNIDGLIRTINSSNPVSLFLINPAGMIFGGNASLNIGGSFVGTTANSVKFSDGVEFSALSSQTPPLLSVNVPIGLQMGSNPAAIAAQGTGYSLTVSSSAPIARTPSPTELRVQPGRTLALVGGNLALNGATLTAEQGRIELGSLSGSGLVNLVAIAQGYALNYATSQNFGDIQLTQKSLLDVSGVTAGSVQVQGRQIRFANSSLVLSQNLGNLPAGELSLRASSGIDLTDAYSGMRSEALGRGTGSAMSITTPQLSLRQGGTLRAFTYGIATSGNIQVNATAIEVSGFSPVGNIGSVINTTTAGIGNAGSIVLSGDRLLLSNGGGLSSISQGRGSSGQVTIRNQETIVQGSNSAPIGTRISSTTFSSGNANTLTLNTGRLQLLDGGAMGTSSFGTGQAGDLQIHVTESILIRGSNLSNPSGIGSSVQKTSLAPNNQLTGNAGTIQITTPNLTLENGGSLSVTNQGSGNGGSINITANVIQLKNQAVIQAKTTSGDGGNIHLQVGSLLLLRANSQITATAGGNGNGGNITINSPIIAGFENSDIVANAVKGRGGNIQITTKGIFGLKFRNQLTPQNDITASSQFGVSGTVQISNLQTDPASGLVELPMELADSSQMIATGCNTSQGNSFVMTGRGGVPISPMEQVISDRPWNDLRPISQLPQGTAISASPVRLTLTAEAHTRSADAHGGSPQPTPLIEASTIHRTTNGTVELIADSSANSLGSFAQATCALSSQR